MFAIAHTPRRLALLAVPMFAILSACSRPEPKAQDVRPVRAIVLAAGDVTGSAEFAGEVRARHESRLGFRVGGKIVERQVDVGATVRRGQALMRLDPQDLKLAQAQAQAALRAAETARDLADADAKRYQELRARQFVSQAVLDAKVAALRQAQANAEAARAAYRAQSNQAAYTALVADAEGVVTGIDAEVGQVVAPGTPVVRVARTDEREVVIGVPEDRVEALRKADAVTVRLWANPGEAIPGKVREIAPMADPATRTYAVRVSVPPRPGIRLGMTAAVEFRQKGSEPVIRVPLGALVQDKGASAVWVVEDGVARITPVRLGQPAGNDVVVTRGLRPGQAVVTAGVHVLKSGQKVRILTADVAQRRDADVQAAAAGAAK